MEKLKAELFDIRRQIDILDAKKQELVNLYNTKLKELIELEKQENKNELKKVQ